MMTPPKLTRRARTALVIAVAVCGIVAAVAYAPAARWWTRSRGEHLTAADASTRQPLALPQGATDVRYYLHTQPDRVLVLDFAVEELAFLVWASAHGWTVEPLREAVSLSPRLGFGDTATTVVVRDGYGYRNHHDPKMKNTVLVVYDRPKGRAYYSFWSAPQG